MAGQRNENKKKRFASWMSAFPFDAYAIRLHEIAWMEAGEDFSLSPGRHRRLLFCYTSSGAGTLSYDGKEYAAKAGDAFIADLSREVEIRSASPRWELIWLQMSSMLADKLLAFVEKDRGFIMPVRADVPALCGQIYEFARTGEWTSHADLELSALLYRLMGLLITAPRQDSRMEQTLLYIHQHYAEDIQIDTLARVTCMSRFHFIRQFHEKIGMTPLDYITEYRVKKAQDLLVQTDKPISVVASLVGFSDHSYFARKFKKLTGSLPREHRTMYRTP